MTRCGKSVQVVELGVRAPAQPSAMSDVCECGRADGNVACVAERTDLSRWPVTRLQRTPTRVEPELCAGTGVTTGKDYVDSKRVEFAAHVYRGVQARSMRGLRESHRTGTLMSAQEENGRRSLKSTARRA